VGGTLGGIAAVAIVVVALLICRKRKLEEASNPDMFTVGQSDLKGSIDEIHPNWHSANTVPTPLTYTVDGRQSYLQNLVATQASMTGSIDSHNPTSLTGKQAAVRRHRQKELELQIRYLQDELRTLGPGLGPASSALLSPERAEDARQMDLMREQIALLQSQQNSSWAQGLTDEPPPGYTADTVASRIVTPEGQNRDSESL